MLLEIVFKSKNKLNSSLKNTVFNNYVTVNDRYNEKGELSMKARGKFVIGLLSISAIGGTLILWTTMHNNPICLVKDLKHKDPHVRVSAADKLWHINPLPKAIEADLATAMGDENENVRSCCLKALKNIPNLSPTTLRMLIRHLQSDPDGSVRAGCAEVLGNKKEKSEEAVPVLLGMLCYDKRESHAPKRRLVAWALGNICSSLPPGDSLERSKVISCLERTVFEDPNVLVKPEAAMAYFKLTKKWPSGVEYISEENGFTIKGKDFEFRIDFGRKE